MAYPNPFLRLVVSGTKYGVESWSWGLSLGQDFPADGPPATVPQGVIDAVVAFHTTAKVSSSSDKLTSIKLNEIGTDGKYTSSSETVQHDFDPPVAGVTSLQLPAQLALAVSLQTTKARGRASRGRFYLPCAVQVFSDGYISPADQTAIATAATTFINALHTALPGYRAAVMSNIGTGERAFVTGVRVGRIIDTMRSRRRNLLENYVDGAPLADPGGA